MAGTAIRRVNARRSLSPVGHAVDAPRPGSWRSRPGRENPISAILFGSLDAAPSGFATAGAKIAFDRVDREGFVVLASVGAGRRAETGPSLDGRSSPSLMRWTIAGQRPRRPSMVYRLGRDRTLCGTRRIHGGAVRVRRIGDSAGSVRASSPRRGLGPPHRRDAPHRDVILGSAHGHAWGRLSYGVRVWGAYLGPEAALYADETAIANGASASTRRMSRWAGSACGSRPATDRDPARRASPYVASRCGRHGI